MPVFLGGMEENRVANSVIWLREKCVVYLSLELQQIECALAHGVNDLCVKANCEHFPIIYCLILSYRTKLIHIHTNGKVASL